MNRLFLMLMLMVLGLQLSAFCEEQKGVRSYSLNVEQFGRFNKLIEQKVSGLVGCSRLDVTMLLKQAGLNRSELLTLNEVMVTVSEMEQINKVYSKPIYDKFEKKYSNFFFVKCKGTVDLVCIMTKGNNNLKEKDKRKAIHVRDKYGRIWRAFKDSIKIEK